MKCHNFKHEFLILKITYLINRIVQVGYTTSFLVRFDFITLSTAGNIPNVLHCYVHLQHTSAFTSTDSTYYQHDEQEILSTLPLWALWNAAT